MLDTSWFVLFISKGPVFVQGVHTELSLPRSGVPALLPTAAGKAGSCGSHIAPMALTALGAALHAPHTATLPARS